MAPASSSTERPSPARRARPLALVSVIAAAVVVSAFVGFSKELIRRYQINKDIREAREQISEMEKKNSDLSYLVDYLQTDSFKEIQARQNLGLQKKGETAVLVEEGVPSDENGATVAFGTATGPSTQQTAAAAATVPLQAAPSVSPSSNIGAWWRYFFAKQVTSTDESIPTP